MILQVGRLQTPNVAAAGQGYRWHGNPLHFVPHGLAAIWEPLPQFVTLNGTDVSGLASRIQGGIDVAQGTAANQPLYTGAPTYGSPSAPQPSIQFTAANIDTLQRAATNLIGVAPATWVTAQRLNAFTGTFSGILANGGGGTGEGVGYSTTSRAVNRAGAGNPADGVPSTAVAEIWVVRSTTPSAPEGFINNVAATFAPGGIARSDPGGAGVMYIGSFGGGGLPVNMDFLAAAVFQSSLPDSVAVRISKAWGARFGLAV